MTDFTLIAVGRLKAGPMADLAALYLKRLAWPVTVHEIEVKGTHDLKAREAEAILARIPGGAALVALDERGNGLSSAEFAAWLERQRIGGTQHVAFVVGGADGLDATVRDRADLLMAFGRMTWPHMLARVMLLEQLYRAQQILAGHPYHRE